MYIQSCISCITYNICSRFEKASILHKLSVHTMSTVHVVFLYCCSLRI